MSAYEVVVTKTLDWVITVEADSPKEAEEKASESHAWPGALCGQCAHEANDGEWDVDSVHEVEGGRS